MSSINPSYSFKNRTYIVTGATSAIGRELVALLLQRGAKLILLGRNSTEHLAQDYRRSLLAPVDYLYFDALADDEAGLTSRLAGPENISGLFINHGDKDRVYQATGQPALQVSLADQQHELQMYRGSFRALAMAALPRLLSQARIVVVGSVASETKSMAGFEQFAYAQAKAAQRDQLLAWKFHPFFTNKGIQFDLYHVGVLNSPENRTMIPLLAARPRVSFITRWLLTNWFHRISIPPHKVAVQLLLGFNTHQGQRRWLVPWWLKPPW